MNKENLNKKSFLRFIENKYKNEILTDAEFFIKRVHGLPNYVFFVLLVGALAGSLTLTMLLIYDIFQKAVHIPDFSHVKVVILLASSVLIVAIMGIYTISHVQKTRKILLYTEFQNMIFSNISRQASSFLIVVSKKGHLVYFDKEASDIFKITSQPNYYNISALFGSDGFSGEQQKIIESCLEKGKNSKFNFSKANHKFKVKMNYLEKIPSIAVIKAVKNIKEDEVNKVKC